MTLESSYVSVGPRKAVPCIDPARIDQTYRAAPVLHPLPPTKLPLLFDQVTL